MDDSLKQKFGYGEMYEWENPQELNKDFRLGRFVTFSKKDPLKIVPVNKADQQIIGITTVNSVVDSDNPNEWAFKNLCDIYGDIYLRKEKLAVGEKVYDQLNEMNYIRTRPWEHYIPITNPQYNKDAQYVKRSNRIEWVNVNLMGKAIVVDNGKCEPGKYCMPYTGKVKALYGSAVPATDNAKHKYYVLARLSEKTILVFNK